MIDAYNLSVTGFNHLFVIIYSNSVDQVMPMKTTNNSLQGGQVLMWNGAQKRKAEDFFVSVENVSKMNKE